MVSVKGESMDSRLRGNDMGESGNDSEGCENDVMTFDLRRSTPPYVTCCCESEPKKMFLGRCCQRVRLSGPSGRTAKDAGFLSSDVPTFDI